MLPAEVILSLLGPASPAASIGYTQLHLTPIQITQKEGLGVKNQTDYFIKITCLQCFDADPILRLDLAIF